MNAGRQHVASATISFPKKGHWVVSSRKGNELRNSCSLFVSFDYKVPFHCY